MSKIEFDKIIVSLKFIIFLIFFNSLLYSKRNLLKISKKDLNKINKLDKILPKCISYLW